MWYLSTLKTLMLCVQSKGYLIITQRRQRGIPNHHAQNRDTMFAFDRVFDKDATSVEVFQHTTRDLVTEVLQGFNCTCFAYGPTGAQQPQIVLTFKALERLLP